MNERPASAIAPQGLWSSVLRPFGKREPVFGLASFIAYDLRDRCGVRRCDG
jgi:hypothetical protein